MSADDSRVTYCASVVTGFALAGNLAAGTFGASFSARTRSLEVRSAGAGMSSATRLSPLRGRLTDSSAELDRKNSVSLQAAEVQEPGGAPSSLVFFVP